jgi:predicted amidophosphoribosyltransferase
VPEVAPPEASVPKADVPPRCPDCDAPVDPTDKFCAECSYPLKEDVKDDAPVVSTGRRQSPRHR